MRYRIAILLFISSLSLSAQVGQFRFQQLDVNRGLSHNQVTCFFKDKKGFIWIGTASGLNRFDGYSIKIFTSDLRDSTSLPNNFISSIFELPSGELGVVTAAGLSIYHPATERFENNTAGFYKQLGIPTGVIREIINEKNNYWIIYSSAGLIHYDAEKKQSVSMRHVEGDSASIASDLVTSMAIDRVNRTWIVHSNGVLERIAPDGDRYVVTYRNDFLKKKAQGQTYDYRLMADQDGDLWIYSINDPQGIYFFKWETKSIRQFTTASPDLKLNTNIVTGVVQDESGLIWVGTDHGGIDLINKWSLTVRYIYHEDDEESSLAQNSIISLYKDREGIIWIGTFKRGASYFHKNIIRFQEFKHYPQDKSSLPFGDVNRFVEDSKGNLWIGTNGGGLIYYDHHNNHFTQYRSDPRNSNSLSSDVIVSLLVDDENTLWIGSYLGGLDSFDGKKFTRYNHDPQDPNSVSDRNVWELFEDSKKRMWIGTIAGGLDLYDRRTKTFSHFRSGDINSVSSNYISAIAEDKNGNLWIGTGNGVDVLMRETGRFVHYQNEQNNPRGISNNSILDIKPDTKGNIWIGTQSGLNLFNAETKTFRAFNVSDGLPHNTVLTILEGNNSDLWISTPNGISNLVIKKDAAGKDIFSFRNFDESDGLQGRQFNENAAFKTSRGELIFGGPNGFNVFRPEQIGVNEVPPTVVLTDFQLFNKSIRGGEVVDRRVILDKSISEAEEIVLPHNKNVFSIEFTALNFFHPERNQYKYILEGFNQEWITVDSHSRRVTFTNLDPGDYTFRVKAANNDGYWNEQGTSLQITVLPPFWRTSTAFVLYFLLILGGLLLARKIIQQREQMKYAIEAERKEALRMHELDMMKIKFFTNVSHEFRTPLTLILTPLERLLKEADGSPVGNQLVLIQRNAKRLLNLVNQLLDFRKLEVEEIRFNPSEGDIIAFISDTVASFSDVSEKKDIRLEMTTSVQSLETIFDQDKLEKILFNLLSNAFKFTPEHGAVKVEVATVTHDNKNWLDITVTDTGIGIPPDKLDKIFERFFQSDLPLTLINQGSGIGLSITKEFVRVHGGTITVESQLGAGSSFAVRIPVESVMQPQHAVVPEAADLDESNVNEEAETMGLEKPTVLLVEDSEDFRFYLKDNLNLDYNIIEGRNGNEGLTLAFKHIPDLIVSDVMMPAMDGIELCRRIKHDERTSHIPVILLTARAADEQKVQGFEAGADDYVTKPFNFEILVSRIRNLIARREQFQKVFQKHLDVKASELTITPLDEQFIQKAIKSVEENLASPEFSVEDLSRHLGISRANLYKKILSLTGKSPLEFIRTIRMQQAAQLLEKSQLTVAEIAYKVGFNNPKYFARYFKEAFNVLPSVYAAEKRKM